jgi:hypothetical protein
LISYSGLLNNIYKLYYEKTVVVWLLWAILLLILLLHLYGGGGSSSSSSSSSNSSSSSSSSSLKTGKRFTEEINLKSNITCTRASLHTDMIKIPQSVLQIDNNVKHY